MITWQHAQQGKQCATLEHSLSKGRWLKRSNFLHPHSGFKYIQKYPLDNINNTDFSCTVSRRKKLYRSAKVFQISKSQYRIPRELLSMVLQETQSKHSTRLTPESPLSLLKTLVLSISDQETGLVPESWGGPRKPRNTQQPQSWAVSEFIEYDSH